METFRFHTLTFTLKSTFAVAVLMSVPAQAGMVFSNGLPDDIDSRNITAFRDADDFVLGGSANIVALRFWFTPGNGTDFSGTLTYAFYNNSAGSLGSLITSGTVSGLIPVPTGGTLPICNVAPHCPVEQVDLNLSSSVPLGAGTYWLELHEGPSLTSNDGTRTNWATSAQDGRR